MCMNPRTAWVCAHFAKRGARSAQGGFERPLDWRCRPNLSFKPVETIAHERPQGHLELGTAPLDYGDGHRLDTDRGHERVPSAVCLGWSPAQLICDRYRDVVP